MVSTTVSGVIFKGTASKLDLGTVAYVEELFRAFKAYISTSSPPSEVFLLLAVVSSSMMLVLFAIVGELSSEDSSFERLISKFGSSYTSSFSAGTTNSSKL